jgi:predicted lipoprotein with Yx(FWY)xxD motif
VKRTTYALALLAALGALVIAGCGGGGSSSESSNTESSSSGSEPAASTTAGGASVNGSEISGLGTVLVDSKGMTVYEFTVDKGTMSECYGECEAAWPPVTSSGKPTAGEGAVSADLGTTKRKDGTEQVTYKGHPLYTFAADKAPGEANGNEADGTWFVLNEAGTAVKGKATPAAATNEGESAPSEGSEEEGSEESSGGAYGY